MIIRLIRGMVFGNHKLITSRVFFYPRSYRKSPPILSKKVLGCRGVRVQGVSIVLVRSGVDLPVPLAPA